MKRLLAFLALCIPIYIIAQGFGSFTHDQPYFAKDVSAGSTSNTFPNTGVIKYRWRIQDVTNSPVGTWIDTIATNVMYQTNNPPTTNSTGVKFTDQYLWTTNINFHWGTNALLLILDDPTGNGAASQLWITEDFSGRIFLEDTGSGPFLLAVRDSSAHYVASLNPTNIVDVLFVNRYLGYGGCDVYTNGVLSLGPSGIGELLADFNQLGMHRSAFGHYTGGIKEIIIWTGTNFNAAGISNIHYYATNTYSFSP